MRDDEVRLSLAQGYGRYDQTSCPEQRRLGGRLRQSSAPSVSFVMAGELDEISKSIGGLEAKVEILTRTVRENQEAATEEHRKVHDIVVATSEAVRNLAEKVKKMEPLTDDYREKRAETRGAARLAKWLYVTGGGFFAAVSVKLLDYLMARPHP